MLAPTTRDLVLTTWAAVALPTPTVSLELVILLELTLASTLAEPLVLTIMDATASTTQTAHPVTVPMTTHARTTATWYRAPDPTLTAALACRPATAFPAPATRMSASPTATPLPTLGHLL